MKYSEVFTKPQPRNLNEVRFLTQNFQNEFNRILSINKIEAISFAESFFHQFPFQRHLSRTMAIFFRDQMGLSSGYRRLIKTFVDVTQNLSMIGRSVYNLPPIFENMYSMERIGEMVEQTAVACQAQRWRYNPQGNGVLGARWRQYRACLRPWLWLSDHRKRSKFA